MMFPECMPSRSHLSLLEFSKVNSKQILREEKTFNRYTKCLGTFHVIKNYRTFWKRKKMSNIWLPTPMCPMFLKSQNFCWHVRSIWGSIGTDMSWAKIFGIPSSPPHLLKTKELVPYERNHCPFIQSLKEFLYTTSKLLLKPSLIKTHILPMEYCDFE